MINQGAGDKNGKRNVFLLGVTSFFTDVSSEMIMAVLPIFLKNVLAAPFTVIGFIDGAAEGLSSFLKYFSGWLSDKIKKRKLLAFWGYAFSSLAKFFLIFANTWPFVFFIRILDRTGKGLRTSPRDALITESVDSKEQGKYFGLHRAMDSSGAFLGTALVILIFYLAFRQFFVPEQEAGPIIKTIFIIAFFPMLLALTPFFFIKEKPKVEINEAKKEKSPASIFNFRGLPKKLYQGIFILAVLALGNVSYAFFILKSQAIGMALFLLPVLYLVYNLFYAAFSYPSGKLSDKLGRTKVLLYGFMILGLVLLSFGFNESKTLIWFLFACYGIGVALTDGVARAFISDIAPESRKGESFGLYHMTLGVASILGNTAFGLIWDKTNQTLPFAASGILVFLGAILLVIYFGKHSRSALPPLSQEKTYFKNHFRAYRA